MKRNISTLSEKLSDIKFRENSSSGSRVIPCGRTDRHDETYGRFREFCERAYKKSTFCFRTVFMSPVWILGGGGGKKLLFPST